MASRNTPGLGLQAYWDLGEPGWKTGMDNNIWTLSVLVHNKISDFVTSLPSSPTNGDMVILQDTGEAFHNHLHVYDEDFWVPVDPIEGQLIYNEADGEIYQYKAASGWNTLITKDRIKSLYEANANTNAFTDALKTKLEGIEANATADMSPEEIKIAYEANVNTNAFTDDEKAKLASLGASRFLGVYTTLSALRAAHPSPSLGSFAYVDQGPATDIVAYLWDDTSEKYVPQAAGNTMETPESIKAKYEANDDTNVFTDAEKSKLALVDVEDVSIENMTASVTLSAAYDKKYIRSTSDSDVTVTVPANSTEAIPVGTVVLFRQVGMGQITFSPATGVSITHTEEPKTRKQHSTVTLIKTQTDLWELFGDLAVAE